MTDYKPMDDGSDDFDALVMREYVYLLTYAEWGYINEFVDGGSLAPEWADDARSASEIANKNPLGHALFTDYISKIISKPSEVILKEIFSAGAPSGYIPEGSHNSDSGFSALIKSDEARRLTDDLELQIVPEASTEYLGNFDVI